MGRNLTLRQAARIAFVIGIAVVTWFSLVPGESLPAIGVWDKAQHMVTYAALGACGAFGFPRTRTVVMVVVSLAVFGCVLESIQELIPGRAASANDALANALGAAAGSGAARLSETLASRAWTAFSRARSTN